MAIYHCSAKVISRSSGRSATGAAAYRAASHIVDNRTGLIHDYTRKGGVDHSMILAPDHSPSWVHDRLALWNHVEQVEKRKDAQLCREVEVALPRELAPEEMQRLVTDYAQHQFVDKGMIADINIHHAEGHNPHAHILLTTRSIGVEGFGKKNRDWNKKERLQEWRVSWETYVNHVLENKGHAQRIDHRTLAAQGIERIPQIHLGAKVTEMEFRGQRTERGTHALDIDQTNAQIIDLQAYREAIEHECHQEIKKRERPGALSDGDRTVSAGNGNIDRRYATDVSGSARSEQSPGRAMVSGTSRDSGRVEAHGQGFSHGSGGADRGFEKGGASGERLAVESVVGSSGGFDDAYSGALDRIVGLAGAGHRDRKRQDMAVHSTRSSRIDRTYLAVRRQLKGMGCEGFEVGIRGQNGQMITREWSRDEVLKAVPWLKRENAKGSDIYVRPSGVKNQGIVLVDDLDQGQLQRMKDGGVAPASVVETSPMNYQAWVRISEVPLAPDVATIASKGLASYYHADEHSADWRHFGRLSGFTNRKPEHVSESGRNPWVLCHESSGQVAVRGEEMVNKAEEVHRQRMLAREREYRLERLVSDSKRASGRSSIMSTLSS